jgi:nitrogen regulatory protein PII
MRTYEVTFIEKKKFVVRVEAEDRPEAMTEAIEKVKRGAEGLVKQHTLDVFDVEQVIIA